MSTVYLLDPSSTLVTNIVTKTGSKMSIGNQSLPSAPNTAGAIVLNVQGPTSSNNVSAFQIPADTSANRPTTNYPGYIRYNTTNNTIEFWSGSTSSWQPISSQPPSIASVSPPLVTDQAGGNIVTIVGSNFVAIPSVFFVDNQSLSTAASSVTFNSSSSLTATFPTSLLPNSNLEPYSVRVTNISSGLSATLSNCINVNLAPYWSPSNSLGSSTVLTVDGSVNLTKASNIRCIAIDPETPPVDLSYSLTNDTSQNLVPANVTLDISGYLISTSTPRLASATSYSFQVYARERTGDSTLSAIGYFNLSVNGYYPLLSFSALSGLTVTVGYVDNNGLNYTTSGPYNATTPGYTIYSIQCTNSASTSTPVGAYTVTKGGTTGTGTITYPTTVNGGCPSFLTCFILAGGGGGGGNQAGSGGGAGGLLYNQCYSLSGLAGTQASIQVGQGGTSAAEPSINSSGINGGQGVNSFLGSNIATGGAGGRTMDTTSGSTTVVPGTSGGSGSGASSWQAYGTNAAGGSGTNQLTITSQGNAGGSANNVANAGASGHSSGGGGGAAGPGTNSYPKWLTSTSGSASYTVMNAGWGGNGISTTITGSSLQVAGGGGGGCYYGTAGNGGVGGGGGGLSNNANTYSAAIPPNGAAGSPATDKNGASNTGGGGGGGGLAIAAPFATFAGNGGCGIMILRHVSFIAPAVLNTWSITSSSNITTTTIYLNNAGSLINSGAGPSVNGGYTVLVFTSTGNGNTGTCTFTPTTNIGPNISYLVCAGGGSSGSNSGGGSGGGGGGGVLVGNAFPVSINTGYSIQVGRGGQAFAGPGGVSKGPGLDNTTTVLQGVNSTFGSITALGGGGSGCGNTDGTEGPSRGGCGGGGGEFNGSPGAPGTIGQGYAGGSFQGVTAGTAAGGGGAGGPGGYSTNGGAPGTVVGAGGPGLPSTITGTLVYYGGGGGASANGSVGSSGGFCGPTPFTSAGNGGTGFGTGSSGTPTSGMNGYGGGGGGTWQVGAGTLTGGAGTVILRIPSYTMS